jgi:hypothetical protein
MDKKKKRKKPENLYNREYTNVIWTNHKFLDFEKRGENR